MSLSSSDKIKQINNIYQDFLKKARAIETRRDKKIEALFQDDDQEKITQILSDLKIKPKE